MWKPSRWACPVALLLLVGHVHAQGLSPKDARDRMVVPKGFQVEVFASEPDIRQPVAACFDERGRMWVIEYLQYPTPAGLVPVKVDQYLRTEYDRVPEPPPKGPRGADRIKILEDTDGDGKVDKVTTFLEGLNLASAIAVGHGGVFVGQAPYLLFYSDKDRDDKPDGPPQVLLSGFGLQDAHATVNSLTWGPDGWLYGAQGSTVTAKIRGVEFQQGIWRFHPKTKKFELFAEGGGNTWGLDFDRGGNAFGSSNGSFIAFHMVQGGNYWKGFAKHGPLHNPRTYGYFDAIPFTGNKPGGHVTPGGIIYKGEQFPEEFRGAFIGANLLSNSVYWYRLAPKGSTFTMTLGGTLLESRDPWFRPIDLLTGPDGSVYVVDWYDKRASHLDPRDTWDRTNGRIYKISYGKPAPVKPFDLSALPTGQLIALRDRPNDWWPETARRILYERNDPVPRLSLLQRVLDNRRDEALALRDLFALNACGGLDDAEAVRLMDHPLPGVRRWVVRLVGDDEKDRPKLSKLLLDRAFVEGDPTVRVQLASTAGRLPAGQSLLMIARLARRDSEPAGEGIREDDATHDPFLPLVMWWAVERLMRLDPASVVAELTEPVAGGKPAVLRKDILPRMARALAEDGTAESLSLCARLLETAENPEDREAILASMDQGLQGKQIADAPATLKDAIESLGRSGAPSVTWVKVSVRLGGDKAYADAIARLGTMPPGAGRTALIELLGAVRKPEGKAALLKLLERGKDDPEVGAALSALAGYAEPDVAEAIIAQYPKWAAPMRSRALDALSARKTWAAQLVDAMNLGRIGAKDLTAAQARRIASLGDSALTEKLSSVWGRLPVKNAPEKTRRIAEVRGVLPEGDKGNPSRGREVFVKNCAACHRLFGEGERIGPELTGVERGNLDYLLTSVVDPSAEIRKEYQGQTLALKDGRVLTGLIVEESGGTLVLFDSQKQKTTIPKGDVEDRKAAEVSVMPEGLLDKMPEGEIRDLFRYLQSAGPPAAR